MPKAGKFYCHFEEQEPNFTCNFQLNPELQLQQVLVDFCNKYNSKHGASLTLNPAQLELKSGSKALDLSQPCTELVAAGADIYVCPGEGQVLSAASAATANGAPMEVETPQAPAQPAGPPIKMKVYVHYESAASSKDPTATQAVHITDANKTIGSVIEDFVQQYNSKHMNTPEFSSLNAHGLCARNDGQVVIPVDKPVSKAFKTGDDIWLVSLEEGFKENNAVADESLENKNRIEASRIRAGDKSYYYWAQKPTDEAPAPREAPKQIRTRVAKEEEKVHFKTISSYSFEDDGGLVKVYISMPKIGDHDPAKIQSEFDVRTCCIKVMDYNGFNHRLQVPKLSEEIIPEESAVRARKDTLIVRLSKKKKDHHWYELHKTKGIGEE